MIYLPLIDLELNWSRKRRAAKDVLWILNSGEINKPEIWQRRKKHRFVLYKIHRRSSTYVCGFWRDAIEYSERRMAAPVNDSRYSAGSAIRRIGIPHWTHRRRGTQSRRETWEEEGERGRADFATEVDSFSLPELLAAFAGNKIR